MISKLLAALSDLVKEVTEIRSDLSAFRLDIDVLKKQAEQQKKANKENKPNKKNKSNLF